MVDDTSRVFGQNLTAIMHERAISLRRLSAETGIPFNTISDYANSRVDIPLSRAKIIAVALGKTVDEMTEDIAKENDLKKSIS